MSQALAIEREPVSSAALDQIFREARTRAHWLPRPVSDGLLHEIYDLARLGPTSANTQPARFIFVKSDEAKARLLPAMSEGNREKTRLAPVTALIAWDTRFHDHLPRMFPHKDLRPVFAENQALAEETAFRNSSLQGAYFILAARALGLDCGPMSGFDPAKVNAEFFPDGTWKINFICNLGYADTSKDFPRNPRFHFDEAARIL